MTNITLTQELVKFLFDYRDGFLYWKNPYSKQSRIQIGGLASKHHKGVNRNVVCIACKQQFAARVIFLWHKGWLPEIVDHEDRDQMNDKIDNLRPANKCQNNSNKRSEKTSNCKYLGVCWKHRPDRPNGCYYAQISSNKKVYHIGCFKTAEEAALAYNRAAVKYHGEFANLNIIKPKSLTN
jgi:hypothetical protein